MQRRNLEEKRIMDVEAERGLWLWRRSKPPGEVQTVLNTEKSCKENEEQPQSAPKMDEEQPPVEHSPEKQSPEEPSSKEQSSEEEFFPQELLPEMLVSEEHPPQEHLSGRDLFEDPPPMEQPPCGVGKHKLEEGSFKERLARSRLQFRGDTRRNLSNEEMIKVAEEMEEMKRVHNKLMVMHWKAR
uniref:transcription elongation factor A protein-like 1 n=1 Tax=Halichoerus grypus TaxID=9711 RepID=UPI001659295E|nr:transcription elongation factor A protein-like 1 [Halichoerus grypus]